VIWAGGLIALAALVAAFLEAAAFPNGAAAPPSAESRRGPARTAAAVPRSAARIDTLRLLFTSETRGNLVPCPCPDRPWGGLDRRTGFLARAAADPRALSVDAGGFVPEGEVPLRAEPEAAHRLIALLVEAARLSQFDAIALDPGQRRFLESLAPAEATSTAGLFLDAGRPATFRLAPWGPFAAAVLAVLETLPDEAIVSAADDARRSADLLVVLARTSTGYARIAELTGADVVVLSDGARLQQPIRHGPSWIVGAGAQGREIGELALVVTQPLARPSDRAVELGAYALHPMDETVSPHSGVSARVRRLLDDFGPRFAARLQPEQTPIATR
jgi:hypothetical protein